MVTAAVLACLVQTRPVEGTRFEHAAPFPALAWVRVDGNVKPRGFAQHEARRLGLQGRVLWIDATANLTAVSTPERIEALIVKVADVGFNTVVYDVKPIVGRPVYPTDLATQMTRWRGQTLPAGYDPVVIVAREARRRGLSFLLAMNAFSEGHSFAKRDEGKADSEFGDPGWGYGRPDLQTVRAVPRPTITGPGGRVRLSPRVNAPVPGAPATLYDRVPAAAREPGMVYAAVGADGRVADSGPTPFVGEATLLVLAPPEHAAALSGLVGRRFQIGAEHEFLPAAVEQDQIPLMMNPHDEQVQQRALAFAREAVSRYRPDGFLYDDRLRFGGLDTDFSEPTRAQFESRVGKPLRWPDDVFAFTFTDRLVRGVRPGPYYDAWLAFRAETMATWVARARREVQAAAPGTLFGVYAGSWFGDYPKFGVNYGSDALDAGFPFLTRAYRAAGFASSLDLLVTGCYYRSATIVDAMERGAPPGQTVEAGAVVSTRVARDQTWVYAGIQLADYWGRPQDLERALQAAAAGSQGVMVFDLSHRIDEVWPIFARAFKSPVRPPHAEPGLLERVRTLRRDWDARGGRDRPFPILEGLPGAGF